MSNALFPARVALAVVVITAAVRAQTSWVVDAAGSGQFTDIPAALAVAVHGDTVRVLPGAYTAGATDQGIRLLGGPATTIAGRLSVHDLPAGATFVMAGFQSPPPRSLELELRANGGRVHLEDLLSQGGSSFPPLPPAVGVAVTDCAHVSLNRCTLDGAPALSIVRSTALLSACAARGRSFDAFSSTAPSSGVRALDAHVVLAQPDVAGGGGYYSFSLVVPGAPGIAMSGGSLVVAGDDAARVQGGTYAAVGTVYPSPAIASDGGTVALDPHVRLNPSGGSPRTAGTSAYTKHDEPAVLATGVVPGGNLPLVLDAPAGALAGLLVSLPADPRFFLFDELWLDLPTTIALWSGPVPAGGHVALAVPVGAGSFEPGTALAFQAVVVAGGGIEFSAPATAVLAAR